MQRCLPEPHDARTQQAPAVHTPRELCEGDVDHCVVAFAVGWRCSCGFERGAKMLVGEVGFFAFA